MDKKDKKQIKDKAEKIAEAICLMDVAQEITLNFSSGERIVLRRIK